VNSLTTQIAGGVTAPRGFRATGVHAGIKADRPDMAMLQSETPAVVAGVFTTNRIQAAPVLLCRQRLTSHCGQAIVINSGNANACTGEEGIRNADAMARLTAQALGLDESLVYVCSTGTIGRPMPMDKIEHGIHLAAQQLTSDGGAAAAQAIMTTDTRPKQCAAQILIDNTLVTIGGMAKGAGMIHPNMATLLAFLTTDAAVEAGALQGALKKAVDATLNAITIDGDTSTNDTVLCLANGVAGNTPLSARHKGWKKFTAALTDVCQQLAISIVKDGEGATKMATITVKGAPTVRAADKIARTVANSPLVKTSWFGADPNWGRVICAVGYSGVPVDPAKIDIAFNGQYAVKQGQPAGLSIDVLHEMLTHPEFTLEIDVHMGRASRTVYSCDFSDKYVEINASYMT